MTWINLLYFLFGLTLLFSFDDVEGIVGGEKAKVGEYTYQVSIMIKGRNRCGGSIFDDYHIITAARCVVSHLNRFKDKPFKVLAGVNKIGSNSTTRVLVDVEKIYALREFVRDEYFTPCISGDIAVLKLKDPLGIGSNPNLSKIRLPEKKSYVNETAIITGFGWNWIITKPHFNKLFLLEYEGYSLGNMHFAEAIVRSNENCQKYHENYSATRCLCAQIRKNTEWASRGACSYDIGGPLVYNGNVLIGVLSTRSNGCNEKQTAAFYTRVSHYLNFIKKAVKDESDPEILSTTLQISP